MAMKKLRETFGLEVFELAECCGVSTEDILAFEAGDKTPSPKVFKKIAGALCPESEYLISGLMVED
jgi:transcriptional regulator with XRE-family HTH domain